MSKKVVWYQLYKIVQDRHYWQMDLHHFWIINRISVCKLQSFMYKNVTDVQWYYCYKNKNKNAYWLNYCYIKYSYIPHTEITDSKDLRKT